MSGCLVNELVEVVGCTGGFRACAEEGGRVDRWMWLGV